MNYDLRSNRASQRGYNVSKFERRDAEKTSTRGDYVYLFSFLARKVNGIGWQADICRNTVGATKDGC